MEEPCTRARTGTQLTTHTLAVIVCSCTCVRVCVRVHVQGRHTNLERHVLQEVSSAVRGGGLVAAARINEHAHRGRLTVACLRRHAHTVRQGRNLRRSRLREVGREASRGQAAGARAQQRLHAQAHAQTYTRGWKMVCNGGRDVAQDAASRSAARMRENGYTTCSVSWHTMNSCHAWHMQHSITATC